MAYYFGHILLDWRNFLDPANTRRVRRAIWVECQEVGITGDYLKNHVIHIMWKKTNLNQNLYLQGMSQIKKKIQWFLEKEILCEA